MLESLLQILPVFLIMGFGVVLDILDLLPKRTGSYVGAYVLYAALPMLLLDILSGSSLGDLLHGGFWAGFALSQVLIYILGYTLDYFLARRGHGTAVCFALSCSFSNVAFIGLPVIASLFPGNHVALLAAGITVIVPNLLVIPSQVQLEYLKYANPGAGNAAVEGGQGVATHPLRVLRKALLHNQLVWATLLGFVLGLTGLGLWGPLDKAVTMIGSTTAPCMLFALGLDLRAKIRLALGGERGNSMKRLTLASVIKLVVHPLLAWLLLAMFGVSGVWLVVGVIQSGTATALVTTVFAEIYDHEPAEAALIAVVTNVLNLVTLTVLAGVFRSMGLL